ncbi:NAD(P)-dependent oxidoreductase [Magnetospira sp. QH-2]|uniref:NAD(P)-dependent oxidoreductase n=1 Tax=Magnetospira sp. (strain QH-2) TaxID=1288970 RepID=UPI0003E812DB|nr:NAD(P)-dependent oxidoreductase [Magnetospira sp. QH-2]CCQ75503.1 Glyoxylate reductase [Magnetospira sp. QH-2]
MTWKVLVTAPYMLPIVDDFADFFAENDMEYVKADVQERMEEEDLIPIIGDYDGLICGDDRVTPKVLDAAPKLKVISKWGTGIDSIDKEEANKRGIRVCRTLDAFTEPVGDSALGYILCFARRLPWMDQQMKAGIWDKIPGRALNECTVGVVGVGATGSATLRRAKACGAEILGNDIRVLHPGHVKALGVEMVALDELLERSDFVCVHADLTDTSYHLMSTHQFEKMKPTAVMTNLGRGPVVDEKALVKALQDGQIAGAALDVFEDEPLPADSPLRGMDNVMLAPHNSNSSPKAWNRIHDSTLSQLLEGLKAGGL